MTNLKNAPLIYTLGVVQFPRVPSIDRYADEFFKLIREQYPLDEASETKIHTANITQDGINIGSSQVKIWQFASTNLDWGFILNERALSLHTSQYINFEDFLTRLINGLKALTSISDIGIRQIISIGLRYVNMVIVKDVSDQLVNYLKPWILPNESEAPSELSAIEGIYLTRYKTPAGEMRLQILKNPPYTIPPELNSQFMTKNGWIKERPENTFAIIDIDHIHKYEFAETFDIRLIIDKINELRNFSSLVFKAIATEKAKHIWKEENHA